MVQFLDSSLPVDSTDHHELTDSLSQWTTQGKPSPESQPQPFKREIVWVPNALGFLVLHLGAVYGIFLCFSQGSGFTLMWCVFLMLVAGLGVTMGAHRMYSHKAFKAKAPLRLALVLLQTMAGQNCMYIWVRDHRQHHKYSDTDADPHNARRGFFFSHIGWLMSRKHPDVIAKGKGIDMRDIEADAFVMFQKKYYKTLYTLLSVLMPMMVPVWLWGEDPYIAFMTAFVSRQIVSLNLTWLVNSAAHKFGTRPYTSDIVPVESELVSMIGLGEGWHNYHHTFPWDYKAAELGQKWNLTTTLLDTFARWGWVYDLREVTPSMVLHRIQRRGDGSHPWSTLDRQTSRTPGL